MKQLHLSLSITHISNNLSEAEHHPQLCCYLDSRFDREDHTIHLNKPIGEPYQIMLSGIGVARVNSAICFAQMAWRNNDFGVPCLLDAGTNHVTFGEIVDATRKSKNGTFVKDIPMLMHTANNFEKGVFRISMGMVKHQDLGLRLPPIGQYIQEVNTEIIKDYIDRLMGIEQSFAETFQGTERMRMPYDYSQSGFQSTNGMPLPAIAYALAETPKSNTHYWENAFKTIMARDDLKPEEWNRLNIKGKARVSILMACFQAQYLDYVSDTIDTNVKGQRYDPQKVMPYENFGDAGKMGAGDCEDDGGLINQNLNSFIQHEFQHPVYREMQHIAKQYVGPLNLDVVQGAQVNEAQAHYGAHMNDNFIPIQQFQKWLGNTREGRKQVQELPWGTELMKDEGLPFLVGEGTGMYEPLGFENPIASLMGYVYRAPSLQGFKKPIPHKKGETGPFFVGSLIGITDFFYRRGYKSPVGFWYMTNGKTRGVSYDDMMNERHDKISLKLQEPPTAQLMEVIHECVSRRIPPNKLWLSEDRKGKSNTHHVLEKLKQEVTSFKRPQGIESQYVPVYMRPHQLTEKLGIQIGSDMRKLNRVWKVDYQLEEITDDIWGFRVKFFVN